MYRVSCEMCVLKLVWDWYQWRKHSRKIWPLATRSLLLDTPLQAAPARCKSLIANVLRVLARIVPKINKSFLLTIQPGSVTLRPWKQPSFRMKFQFPTASPATASFWLSIVPRAGMTSRNWPKKCWLLMIANSSGAVGTRIETCVSFIACWTAQQ